MIDLSIVIISWRMRTLLENMLHSVRRYTTGLTYELIIVDNDSQDGTADMVRRDFPGAYLIVNPKNLGVAPSRNQALRVATGRYVITLDADMLLTMPALDEIVRFMDATPDAGICGCKLVFPDGTVQPSARRYPTPWAMVMRRFAFLPSARNSKALRYHEMADWDRSDCRTVDYVIGACQCIRREAIDAVGLLDEHIFYGPEDVDYCLRMYSNGWKVYYNPSMSIIHFEQRVTKKRLFTRLSFLHLKGVMYLFWKYRGRLTRDGEKPA
jgi:N-acetylglucosaminyl-diphospho-decaprenol L-rhamnosyltransferase